MTEKKHLLRYRIKRKHHHMSNDESFVMQLEMSLKYFYFRNESTEVKDEEDEKSSKLPNTTEKKSLFDRPLPSKTFKPRAHFRNFSHISEFGNGLEISTKSNKKRDKIDEFLEKKRERNTLKRLHGRKKT